MADEMTTITIHLGAVQAGTLAKAAAEVGITAEEWARRAVTSDLQMYDKVGMQQVPA